MWAVLQPLPPMSNFVSVEFRADSAPLKSELKQIPGMLSAAGRAAEGTAKTAFSSAGKAGGLSMVAGVANELRGGGSRIAEANRKMASGTSVAWGQAGTKSGQAFGSAVLLGTSTIGSRVASNSMKGIVPAMGNAGRNAANAFAKPFVAVGQKIAATLKGSIDSVKDGIGLGIGSQLTGGVISGVTGAVGSAASTDNAAALDAATRRNATLLLGDNGGDPTKALKASRALSVELAKANKELKFVSTTTLSTVAAYDALSTGFSKTSDVLLIMKAALKGAATDGSEVRTVVDGMTSSIKGLKLSASDSNYVLQQMVGTVDVGKITMAEYSSLIGKIAPTIGLIGGDIKQNFEQVNSIIGLATAAGVKPGAALSGLTDALKSVAKPTKEAREEAKALGIVLGQKELAENGLLGILKQLQKSDLKESLADVVAAAKAGGEELSKMGETPSVNLKKLITIFGTVEAVAAIATATGAQGLLDVAKAADQIGKTDVDKKFGLVIGGLTAKTEAFKNKLTDLDAQLKTPGFTDIAAFAVEFMSKAVDGAIKSLGELNTWYIRLQPQNKELVKNVALATAAIVGLVAAVSLLGLVLAAIGAGLATVGVMIAAIITPVGLVIATLAIFGLALYSVKDKIADFANSTVTMFQGWGQSISQTYTAVWRDFSTATVASVNSVLSSMGQFGQSSLDFIGQWGQSIKRGFVDAWEGAKNSSIPGLASLMTGIEDFTKFTIKAFQGMWEYVGGLFQKMGGAIEKLGNDIKGLMGIDATPATGGGGVFVSPVEGGRGLNQTASMAVQRYGAGRPGSDNGKHFGEDYSGAVGAPVKAIAGGVIKEVLANVSWGNGRVSQRKVTIETLLPDGKKLETAYFHMGTSAGKNFMAGMKVEAGEVIGSIGKDGAVGGNVSHVDVKTKIDGASQPPMDVWRRYAQAAVQGTSVTMSTDLKRVLDLIAKGEVGTTGNEGYYKRQGKGSFSADEARRGFPTSVPASENIGRYQVNKGDYDEARKRNPKIKDFSPESQDLIAIERMKNSNGLGSDKGATALRAFIASRTKANAQRLLDDLGAEWESLRDGGTKYKGLDRGKNFRAGLIGSDESIYRQLGVGQSTPVAQAAVAQKPKYEPGQNPANKEKNSVREQKKDDREKEAARNKEERARKKAKKEAIDDAKTADKALGQLAGALSLGKPKPTIAKKKAAPKADGFPDIEKTQLGIESVNADSNAEISRSQLDVDQGIYNEAEGRKRKAEIESRRTKKLAVYMKQLAGLYKKYKGNDKATNELRNLETGINTSASGAATAGKEAGLDAITKLEAKVKAINDKFAYLKLNVEEKRSRGTITEAGAANETSYLNGRLSQSLRQARRDSIALMSAYKDPSALDRLNAITTSIQQQGIEARDNEKARKATALDAGIEAIQKVGRGNATKDFDAEIAKVDALAKAGLSETEALKMKLQLQRDLSAALQGSVPFVERFMAGYKDPKAQDAGKEILANTRAVRAELIAMERENAKRIATDVSNRTDKLTAKGDREVKDVENDRDLGLITEAKTLEKILEIRTKTNKVIQEAVAGLEKARDLQTDPAVLETLNEELAKLRQLNIGNKIAEKQYRDTNEAASLQGQIVSSTKEGLGDLFRSIARGASDLGSVLDSILNKIADILINAALGSFAPAGGGAGGGGLLGMIGSILGFKDGGDVPTKGGIQTIAGISRALKKEGSNAILATLTPGERVLNRREAAIHRAMIADGTWKQATKVYGFAKGGDVGNIKTKARATQSSANSSSARVIVDRINEVNYVSVDQLQAVLEVQLPAAARAGAAMTERNLQSTSWRQSNGIK